MRPYSLRWFIPHYNVNQTISRSDLIKMDLNLEFNSHPDNSCSGKYDDNNNNNCWRSKTYNIFHNNHDNNYNNNSLIFCLARIFVAHNVKHQIKESTEDFISLAELSETSTSEHYIVCKKKRVKQNTTFLFLQVHKTKYNCLIVWL